VAGYHSLPFSFLVRCVGCGDAAADQLSVSLVVVVSNFVFCFWTVFRQTTSSI